MNDNFKPILDTLIREGFYQLPDKSPKSGKPYDFRITPYSLNTKLSFKFDSLEHFIAFLELSEPGLENEKIAVLRATFTELGLDPQEFFYVNFYEKGKDLEM